MEIPSVQSKRFRIFLLGFVSLLFFTLRYNDLFMPYFWDEMAAYMSGVIYMADHGISLHPGSVPAELSYGHPLLLHAVMATIMSLFGSEIWIMHFTIVCFTILLAFGTYALAFQLSKNYQIAILTFLIFLAQPIVFAQSTQVLLEVFLAMHTVYAILFYFRKQYLLSVIFCTMGLLTKETGLVLAIALLVHFIFVNLLDYENKKKWSKLWYFFIPFIVFAVFLFVQKQTYGWYLNPVNVGKSKLDIISMLQKIWDYPIEFTFINQGRYIYSIMMLVLLVLYIVQKKKRILMGSLDTVLILIYCFGFIVFSSIADTLERYFLMLLPFGAILFAYTCHYYERFQKHLPILLCLIGVSVNSFYFNNESYYSDSDLGYKHMIKTNQKVIDFVNSGAFQNDTVGFAFPLQLAVVDTRYGYYKKKRFFADTAFKSVSKYAVYCSPGNWDWNPPDTTVFKLLKKFESGYSKSAIFARR